MRILSSVVIALLPAACATTSLPLTASHPASAEAAEAAAPAPSVLARAEQGPLFLPDKNAAVEGHHHHHGGTP